MEGADARYMSNALAARLLNMVKKPKKLKNLNEPSAMVTTISVTTADKASSPKQSRAARSHGFFVVVITL